MTTLANYCNILRIIALKLPSAFARAECLPSIAFYSWGKWFMTGRTYDWGYRTWTLVKTFFRAIKFVVWRFKMFSANLTNMIAESDLLGHESTPFSGLCSVWGRMAKVSIFSKRVISPFLSHNYYIIGGVP